MQYLPTPVYLVSYIVAMQLSSPMRFHETYKNTRQKSLIINWMEQLVIRWKKEILTETENKSKHKYNGFPGY